MATSTWTCIPPYLHRLSIPLLLGLTILQLQLPTDPSTHSRLLASIFLSAAFLSIFLERTVPSNTTPCKLHLALTLVRATIYAFIGDAAAAQLLLFHAGEEGPLVLSAPQWVQFGLAGSMWLLGALLWVMEPVSYWMTRSRASGTEDVESREKQGYMPLSQEEE